MKSLTLTAIVLSISTAILASNAFADSKPQEFEVCLQRTAHDRQTCEAGCGMILQQCYDEADAAINKNISTLLMKQRSASCATLLSKYSDDFAQMSSRIVADAEVQPGWLGAELKLRFAQQRYAAIKLIDGMCK